MPHQTQTIGAADLERARLMYAGFEFSNAEIGAYFGRSLGWVNKTAHRQGWPIRSKRWRKGGEPPKPDIDGRKVRRRHAHKPTPMSAYIAESKAAMAARERELYGDRAPDVMFLRQRGFVVTRSREAFVVGIRSCTAAELHAVAERERRLAGAAR